MIHITVDNRIRLRLPLSDEPLLEELQRAFTHENPQYRKLAAMGYRWNKEPREYRPYKVDTAAGPWHCISVPRGGMHKVRMLLGEFQKPFVIRDERIKGEPNANIPAHALDLYPFQQFAKDAALAKEQGVLRAPTGSGKTTVGFSLISTLNLWSLVIVPNTALQEQWIERAEKELGLAPQDIGRIGGGEWSVKPLTVAIQKTLATRGAVPLAGTFGLVLCDEAQFFSANTYYEVVDPFRAKYRIAISADERRKDRREFIAHDLFGDVIAEIERADVVRSGHVLDVQIRAIPTAFEAPWYGWPTETEQDRELNFNRLLNEMADDEARNQFAIDVALEEAKEEQVLILTHRREHCLALAQRLRNAGHEPGILMGGADSREAFADSVERFRRGELRVGVGTVQAAGTGLDLPTVAVGVIATPIAGNKQLLNQVRGRFCRTAQGKGEARLYYLLDHLVYPNHLDNLAKWNDQVVVRTAGGWVPAADFQKKARGQLSF